ncbi:blue copper protein-like [Corylus avellana]|uniref:blue copper protein-like n=1 Tax=Corylus avellana TaxID=13451 RepID=UPI001E1F64C6|nr:blue copper protein-like [Corylus avellana]
MASNAWIVCALMLLLGMIVPSLATVHTVGDSGGWALGVDYSTWTSGKTFAVGDSLVFKYSSGHSVDEVSGSDYSSCSLGNSISTDSSGSTTIPLKTAGSHYFICSIVGHCGSGMKLTVTVAKASTAAAPAAPSGTPSSGGNTAITPPAGTTTPTTTTTTSTHSSSGASLSPIMAVVSVATFLAFWV